MTPACAFGKHLEQHRAKAVMSNQVDWLEGNACTKVRGMLERKERAHGWQSEENKRAGLLQAVRPDCGRHRKEKHHGTFGIVGYYHSNHMWDISIVIIVFS